MDNVDVKKAVIGFGLGAFIFYAGLKLFVKKEEKQPEQPPITDENINIAVTAYMDAVKDNAPNSKIAELNDELAKEFGLRVKMRNADGKIVVNDLSGKQVKTF